MNNSYEAKYTCINPSCGNYDTITDWIHSDDHTVSYNFYYEKSREADVKFTGKEWFHTNRFHVEERVCSKCTYAMDIVEERIAEPKRIFNLTHVPADAKTRPGYYTRYKTTTGGKPEWNPVTSIYNTGQKSNEVTQ